MVLTDFEYNQFFLSYFTSPETLPTSSTTILPLTNAIHPLFADDGRWNFTNLGSSASYSTVEQSCRLASRILTSGVLDHFFHLILFVDPSHIPGTSFQYSWPDLQQTKNKLTAAQKTAVQTRLRQIGLSNTVATTSKVISYSFNSMKTGAHTTVCETIIPDPTAKPHGRGSHIEISHNMYRAIDDAAIKSDLCRELYCRFTFAIMLVHELSHFLYSLRESRNDHAEPFFGDECMGEIGFSLENQLFSGHLELMMAGKAKGEQVHHFYRHAGKVSELTGLLVLTEWPYRRLNNEYKQNKETMTIRKEGEDKLPQHDLAWRVPLTFVARLFTDQFWDTDVAANGSNALIPARERGHCFRAVKESHEPVQCSPGCICIPTGYSMLSNGDVANAANKPKFSTRKKQAPTANHFESLPGSTVLKGRVARTPSPKAGSSTPSRRSPRNKHP